MLLAMPFVAAAQEDEKDSTETNCCNNGLTREIRDLYPRKGKFYVEWGYNNSAYSHSDIHFWGSGYDFSITDIRATDGQTPFSATYYKPTEFTIPQFNWRIAYYLSDKTFISFGQDHMKYTMAKQTTKLTGHIDANLPNAGTYDHAEVTVGEDAEVNNPGPGYIDNLPKGFVSNFEHCDGLNDFALEIGRIEQVWISKNRKHALAVTGSAGPGMVIPDSDVDLLGQPPKHDMEAGKKAFHLAGYSLSASLGLQLDLFRRITIQPRMKFGYINLPDINTTEYGGKASQHFNFIETFLMVGYTFKINHNHAVKPAK